MRRVAVIGLKVAAGVLAAIIVYGVVTFVQVWLAARRDNTHKAQAIVVFGAAQYNGRPSAVLRARLDHAVDLYNRHVAPYIVVTGGRQPGDNFTEATASADYLHTKGVPDNDILREVSFLNRFRRVVISTISMGQDSGFLRDLALANHGTYARK